MWWHERWRPYCVLERDLPTLSSHTLFCLCVAQQQAVDHANLRETLGQFWRLQRRGRSRHDGTYTRRWAGQGARVAFLRPRLCRNCAPCVCVCWAGSVQPARMTQRQTALDWPAPLLSALALSRDRVTSGHVTYLVRLDPDAELLTAEHTQTTIRSDRTRTHVQRQSMVRNSTLIHGSCDVPGA